MSGRLEVITGTMFSGKTVELMRLLERVAIAKRMYVVFKPWTDTRSGQDQIKSNNGHSMAAIEVPIDEPFKLIDLLREQERIKGKRHHTVGIDEIQFFPRDSLIKRVIAQLTNEGYRVIAAGLDLDFRREPFGVMPDILAMADSVFKLKAICSVCGEDARYPQRLINGEPAPYDARQVQVGGAEMYEARCAKCHVLPNIPLAKLNSAQHNTR